MNSEVPTPRAVPKAVVKPSQTDGFWKKIMTRKFLVISVLFHVLFGIAATFFIVSDFKPERKKFMPPAGGGDAAKQSTEHRVSLGRKQSVMSAPEQAKRVTTNSALAKVALPDLPDLPTPSTEVFANRPTGLGGAGSAFGATGTNAGGGSGGGSGINFFGLRTRPKNVVLVVDVSDSMVDGKVMDGVKKGPNTYAGLEREIQRVIYSLDPGIQFTVLAFAGDLQHYKEAMVAARDDEKTKAIKWVRERSPAIPLVAAMKQNERETAGFSGTKPTAGVPFNHGGTRAKAALEAALKMSPDTILFVSDGVPTDGRAEEILKTIADLQAALPKPAIIQAVAYLADSGQKFMEELARQNQGAYREIKPGQFGF